MFHYLKKKKTLKKFVSLRSEIIGLRKNKSLTDEDLQIKFDYYRKKLMLNLKKKEKRFLINIW
jgi:hypothetical protein